MIELKGVTMKFDDFTALDNVDLTIEKGKAYGLLGPNGAGKSTILRLLSGVYKPMSGEVKADGEPIFDNPAIKEKIFFINDETIQFNSMTIGELVYFYKGFYPNFSEEVFYKLNQIIKLPEKKKIDKFSKGMKRQAIVITGLAARTDYLLLDEAFDGLDPATRLLVRKMLTETMLKRQLTVVISSHNLHEINELCENAAIIEHGKILKSGKISEINPEEYFRKETEEQDYDFSGLN